MNWKLIIIGGLDRGAALGVSRPVRKTPTLADWGKKTRNLHSSRLHLHSEFIRV